MIFLGKQIGMRTWFNELKNEIAGTTEDDLLLIDVYYDRDKRDALESLEDLAESDD